MYRWPEASSCLKTGGLLNVSRQLEFGRVRMNRPIRLAGRQPFCLIVLDLRNPWAASGISCHKKEVAAIIPILFWILGCYALAAAAVHAYTELALKRKSSIRHYVLIAGNEGLHMERYMRCLRRFSYSTGTTVRVTVLNCGCEDETLGIVRCFARKGMDICVRSGEAFFSGGRCWNDFARELGHRPGQGWSGRNFPSEADGMEAESRNAGRAAKDTEGCVKRERAERESLRAKWQRFRHTGKLLERKAASDDGKDTEPLKLIWMLQEEGIVAEREHAILVNLRNPADLCKLPL